MKRTAAALLNPDDETSNIVPLRGLTEVAKPRDLPPHAAAYPELRYMGSKRRLLPWIHQHLRELDFEESRVHTGSMLLP